MPASPGTTIPLTTPPLSITERNTLNSVSFTRSVTSVNAMSKRRSGLSEPYLSIASSHVMRGIGNVISLPNAVLNT